MSYIILHKVDIEEGQARYYALTWLPAITGDGWALERAWGRLCSPRRQRKAGIAEDHDAVLQEVTYHLRRRMRHDYRIADVDQGGQALLDLVTNNRGEKDETTS